MPAITTDVAYSVLTVSKGHLTTMAPNMTDHTWIETSETVVYYAFPIVIGLGMVLGVLNIVVLANQVTASVDSYLISLTLASTLLVICGGILKLPGYIGYYAKYEQIYPFVLGFRDWFWYTVTWITIIMSLERCMNVSQHRIRSMCTKIQGLIAAIMVVLVTFVSALPEFWEYEVIHQTNLATNQTTIKAERSISASSAEYEMYYWYTNVLSFFLAFPLLLVLMLILMCYSRRSSNRKYSLKHGTGVVLTRKVSEEISITKLHIWLILMYILFTGPLTVFKILPKIPAEISLPGPTVIEALMSIFELSFYFVFVIQFFLFAILNDKFRWTLCGICCCCWHR